MTRILGIEDNDQKWERVARLLHRHVPTAEITRVQDLFEGEQRIEQHGWDLLVLDISLDIRASARGTRGTHDYQAGMKIASRMYYQECEVPTIIITGFDSFPTGSRSNEKNVIRGLEDGDKAMRGLLGDHRLGTVRYGGEDWEGQFLAALMKGLPR